MVEVPAVMGDYIEGLKAHDVEQSPGLRRQQRPAEARIIGSPWAGKPRATELRGGPKEFPGGGKWSARTAAGGLEYW